MLPILTLNNLMQYDPSLFNGIPLPDGADGQTLINTIIYQYGEMQLLIPDWSALRFYTNNWFASHLTQFNRLWSAYQVNYNPVWNKDGKITETRTPNLTRGKTGSDTETGTETRTPNITQQTSYNSGETEITTGTVTQKAQGFNSSAYQGVTQDEPDTTNTNSRTGTDTVTQTGTDTRAVNHSKNNTETETETGTETTTRIEQGNIGVTTTQDMLSAEITLWSTFNFYDTVAKMYATEFMVMLY